MSSSSRVPTGRPPESCGALVWARRFRMRGAPRGYPLRVANLVTIITRSGVAQRLAYDETAFLTSATDDAERCSPSMAQAVPSRERRITGTVNPR